MTRRVELVGPVVVREIRGDRYQVANALRTLRANGDLISYSGARRLGGGRVVVVAEYVDRNHRVQRRRTRRVLAAAGVGTVVLAGAGYAAYRLVLAVVAALPVILCVLFLLGLALYTLLRRGPSCPGLHCSGCRDHR